MKKETVDAIKRLATITGRQIDGRSHVVNTTYSTQPYSYRNTPEYRGRKRISRRGWVDCYRNNVTINVNIKYSAGYYVLTAGSHVERILRALVINEVDRIKAHVAWLSSPERDAERLASRREAANKIIALINECDYDSHCKASNYNCTGIDWKALVRYSSIGGIYICAPDEPANCVHIDKDEEFFNEYAENLNKKIKEFNKI